MRSPRKVYAERVRQLCNPEQRLISIGAQIRVYRRGKDGKAYPAELLPAVYGGQYDAFAGDYIGPPQSVVELKAHPGQLPLLAEDAPSVKHKLALGSPGSGKSEILIVLGVVAGIRKPNRIILFVAPTQSRLDVVWRKFMNVVNPANWVQDIRPGKLEILLKNGTLYKFVSAKRQSKDLGSPLAGLDAHEAFVDEEQNVEDDSIREVEARGRISPDFKITASATNDGIHYFQQRVRELEAASWGRVYRFNGFENVFTPLSHWDGLKERWPKDEWERRIMCLDVPEEGRVYPGFSQSDSVRPVPDVAIDITALITQQRFGAPYQYIVGTDLGIRTTCSVILKAFQGTGADERIWWALEELTTTEKTTDYHARALLERFNNRPDQFLVVADPTIGHGAGSSKDADRSDRVMLSKAGINVVRASVTRITRKHRYSMVNALLHSADSKRRLFVACDAARRTQAPWLVKSFGHLLMNANGDPETHKKGSSGEDLTHWTDALGYGVFPFEKFRGSDSIRPLVASQRD